MITMGSFLSDLLRIGRLNVGLVIGEESVELLSLRGRAIQTHVRVPLEGKAPEHLRGALREALRRAALKTATCAVSLHDQAVLLRYFTMPVLPKADWHNAVQFEARKYIPFRTEELRWTFHVVAPSEAERLEVIFAAIQPDTLHVVQAALDEVSITPTVIEPRCVSLARLVASEQRNPSGQFTCLVELEGATAHLAIVKDGLPYLARSVNLSLKGEGGEAGGAEVTDPRAHRLLSELSVSLDFFMREHPAAELERVLLFGEESLISPWCWWLSEHLHRTVDLGRQVVDRRVGGQPSLSFAAAVGLLQPRRHRAVFDFLHSAKGTAARQPSSPAFSLTDLPALLTRPRTTAFVAVAAGVLMTVWFAGAQQIRAARSQLAQLVHSRPDVGFGLVNLTRSRLDPVEHQAQAQLALLQRVMDRRVRVTEKLDILARSLPDGVWVIALTYRDPLDPMGRGHPSLTLHGACYLGDVGSELSAIQQLGERVKGEAFFRGFDLARVEAIKAGQAGPYTYRTFQLQCDAGRAM